MSAVTSVSELKSALAGLLSEAAQAVLPEAGALAVELERPRQATHGDYASNLALQAAKPLKRNPRELAQRLLEALPASPLVAKAEIAGPGFINLQLTPAARQQVVREVLARGTAFGRGTLGGGRKILLEFVSSNPTGPLHVAHGRAAAFGASLANCLEAAGYMVGREFYVNDAGRQMDILSLSTWFRYLRHHGIALDYPPNCYQGDYVHTMAMQISEAFNNRYVHPVEPVFAEAPSLEADPEGYLDHLIARAKATLGDDWAYIHNHALTEQLGDMRNDLAEFGVHYDCWFSEQSLYDNGLLNHALAALAERGHTYEQDGALWFRATRFGDEKDRVLRRENGLYTYFAPDIAYHLNKFERGYDLAVDVWGPDHHGYIPRVKAAIAALGLDPERFMVIISQLVKLYRDGKVVKLSTRAGNYVTLRDLRTDVGNDAARFFCVLRKSDQHLDFDLDLAKSKTNENPVYYIQYAHARICSVLAEWGGELGDLAGADLSPLESPYENAVLSALMDFPDAVAASARDFAPHVIAHYLKGLAAAFHSYYNAQQFLVPEEEIRFARLTLITAVRQTIANGLALLGVSAPEKM